MKTDVVTVEGLLTKAVEVAKREDGTLPEPELAAAIDAHSAHSIELRFDRELTPDEVKAISDAAFIEHLVIEQERTAAPHVVHEDPVYVDEVNKTYDPDRVGGKPAGHDDDPAKTPFWELHERVRIQATTTCPDCTRGLWSRPTDMICSTLPMKTSIHGDNPWDVVACGRPR